jgi:hypothetical protein
MSSTPKKQPEKEQLALMLKRFIFPIIRFIVSVYRGYIKLHIWSIIVLLSIIMIIGDLLTKSGLILTLGILVYILLNFLDKWLEEHDEKESFQKPL